MILLKRTFCLICVFCFSLITLSAFSAGDEPPKNTLVFTQVFENVADNSWSNLEFPKDEQPPGLYYIELTELVNTIGCWGSRLDPYEDGPNGELLIAWRDGEPMEGIDSCDFRLQYRPTNANWVELIVIAAQGAIGDNWFPFGLVEARESIGQTFIAPLEFIGVGFKHQRGLLPIVDAQCRSTQQKRKGRLLSQVTKPLLSGEELRLIFTSFL